MDEGSEGGWTDGLSRLDRYMDGWTCGEVIDGWTDTWKKILPFYSPSLSSKANIAYGAALFSMFRQVIFTVKVVPY